MCLPRLPNCLALFFLAVLIASGVSAQTFAIPPAPSTLVNDYAGLLSTGERDALERKLVTYNDSTSTQIAVVIFQTLNGADPGMTAMEIGRTWGVGQAGADNGVVLLVSVGDRKLFIATGYGAEAVVTDAMAGRIIRNVIVPLFRADDFEGGTLVGVTAIIGTIEGTYIPPKDGGGDGDEFPWWVGLIFLFSHGLLPMFVGIRALVNPPVGRYFTFVFTLFFIAPMVFIFGGLVFGEAGMRAGVGFMALYLLGYILADIYMRRTPKWQDIRKQVRAAQKKGEITKIDAGWISFSAGGSSSSGGGGGFSGGGGSSGGGGASGSW